MKTSAYDLVGKRDHLLAELLRLSFGRRLGIDADDGLGVGAAQMHPLPLRLEIHLDPVYRVDPLSRKVFLDGLENLISELSLSSILFLAMLYCGSVAL